ncbi:ABC transporter substrate-binding protein [Micromonospora sp. DR5-3]|uniref:ABC transporter substrate-binding protein n=1 Tax=unclassified Micromonospora TaxID=2617518 RepID=UPI001CA33303|nr:MULTISPECIES: ABC transporter substrate-binding protein [unclassified Micromonospora]MCW3818646.1 ABC transporter substrate-binding protein [Micromonospora sp. DR5-3]
MPHPIRRTITIASALVTLAAAGCLAGPAPNHPTGQRLRVVMLLPPRAALSPLSDDAFKLSRLGVAEALTTLDADGTPQPSLAVSWSRTDDRTWRFALRAGVRFHDGTTLDAERAAASITRAATARPKPRILDGVDLTVAPDGPTTLVVRTGTPDPLLPQRLSSPQLSILAAKAYTGDTVDPRQAGTGPFVLTHLNGTQGASLDRFPEHWAGRAAAPGIDVAFVPDGTARTAALRTGAADIVEAVPAAQAALLTADTYREVAMPRTNTLYLNTRRGPFTDPAIRAAARAAVRRDDLVRGVYENRADPAVGLLGPALPWTAARPARAQHPAAPVPGRTIVLATFSDRPELPEVAATLAQHLQAAGFTVRQVVREYAHIETDALAGRFDAFILSRATMLDSGDPVAYLTSDFTCHGGFNLAQLCNPTVDRAVARAGAEADLTARRARILAAEKTILETDAAVPLLHERVIQGNRPGVVDAVFDPRERLLIGLTTRVTQ